MEEIKPEKLQNLGEQLSRYYDLTLEQQERIRHAISHGFVKDLKSLSLLISNMAEVSLPEVSSLIEDIHGGFGKSVIKSKKFSDNILSSKHRLESLLKSAHSLESFYKEAYKLQRKSLQSNVLDVEQMKDALAVTTKQINLRRKSQNASAKDLSTQEVLLQTLKNAGAISSTGFDFIQDAAFGRLKETQKLITKLNTDLDRHQKLSTKLEKRIPDMRKGLVQYVSMMGVRGRLKKQKKELKGRTDLTKDEKKAKRDEIKASIKAVEKKMSDTGYKSYGEFRKAFDTMKEGLEYTRSEQERLNKLYERAEKVYKSQKERVGDVGKEITEILKKRIKLDDVSTSINEKSKILLELMEDATEVNADQIELYSKYMKLLERQQKQTAETSSEEYRAFKMRATFLQKAQKIHADTQKKINSQFDTLAEMSSFVPLIGERLSKGFLDAKQKVSDLAFGVYQEFATTFSKTGNGAKALAAGLKKVFSTPGAILVAGIAAALIAARALFKQMHQLSMRMEEVSKNTGLTADQAFMLEKAATRVAIRYGNVLSSLQDIRDAQASIIKETGYLFTINNDVLNTVSNTGRAYGYGSKMAGQLHAEFMQIAGGSDILAANMQVALASISEAHGLAPGLIAKDILDNSETVAKFFTGYPKDLVKASIALNNMGMSMSQLEKTSAHLLDFEKSITAEFEASVALGRHVNVGKARELLLQGDILGSMQQVGKEMGTLAEFDKMSFAQKSLLAKASEMSVKDLRKHLFIQEKMAGESAGLTTSSLENYEMIQKLTGGNDDLFKVQAKNVQASQKFQVAVQKIAITFRKSLLPLLETMMPLVQLMASGISFFAKILEGILAPINFVLQGFAKVANMPLFADRRPKITPPGDGPDAQMASFSMVPNLDLTDAAPTLNQEAPTSKASIGGVIGKGIGLALFGRMAYKAATGGFKRGKAGGSILDKIPGIGGIGRGNTTSRPVFVEIVKNSLSSLGNMLGVGGSKRKGSAGSFRFKRGGTKPGAGKFVKSSAVARYRQMFGDEAALARFGPNAVPKAKNASRLSKMTSSVGASMSTAASKLKGFTKITDSSSKLSRVFSTVSTGVSTFGRNIGGFLNLTLASGKLPDIFSSVTKALTTFGSNLGGFIKLAASSGSLKGLYTAISSGIGSMTKFFKGKFSSLFKGASSVLGITGSVAGGSMGKIGSKVAGSSIGKGVGKVGGKIAGKLGAKAGIKSIIKKIPGISILAGLLFGVQRLMSGDLLGAAGELTSGVLGTIPGLGTAASVAIDAGLLYKDVKRSKGKEGKSGKTTNVYNNMAGPSGNLSMGASIVAATASGLSLSTAKHSSVGNTSTDQQEVQPKKKSRFRSIAGDVSTLALGGPVALAVKKIKERRDKRKEQKELKRSRLERIVGDVSYFPKQKPDKQRKSRFSRVLGDVSTLALGGPLALMMRKRRQRRAAEGRPKRKSILGDIGTMAFLGPMAFAARKTKSVLSGRKLDTSITPTDAQIGSNMAGSSLGGVTPFDKSMGQVNKAASESVAQVEERADATITREDYKKQTDALIRAIHSLSSQIADMKDTPSIAVIEDSTARDLNRKLKSYNGS